MGLFVVIGLIVALIIYVGFWGIVGFAVIAATTYAYRALAKVLKKYFVEIKQVVTNTTKKEWVGLGAMLAVGIWAALTLQFGPGVYQLASRATDEHAFNAVRASAKQAHDAKKYGEARDLYSHAVVKAERIGDHSQQVKEALMELEQVKRGEAEHGFDGTGG